MLAVKPQDQYRLGANTSTKATTSPPQSPKMATFCRSPIIPASPSSDESDSPQSAQFDECAMAIDQEDACSSATSIDSDDASSSSSMSRASSSSSTATSIDEECPEDCFPSTSSSPYPPSQWRRLDSPCTFPGPCEPDNLAQTDIESSLRFAAPGSFVTDASSTAPPAFFPLQRVSFAPQLKIKTPGGVYLALPSSKKRRTRDGIAGMMLGVTGIVEVLDAEKSKKTGKEVVRTQRMIADFATDLTNGLKIWRRDAAPIVKEKLRVERQWRAHHQLPTEDLDDPSWDEMLAPGTFMLPLSMKIPCSEKL